MSKAKEHKNTTVPSIEEQLQRLEEIATLLDRGEVSLDEQLQLFEEGMKRSAECRAYLENAELRIQQLKPDNQS